MLHFSLLLPLEGCLSENIHGGIAICMGVSKFDFAGLGGFHRELGRGNKRRHQRSFEGVYSRVSHDKDNGCYGGNGGKYLGRGGYGKILRIVE
ncbi:hypothetical protein P691DRAFT_800733 [Macrolepiota fuliginosa MF-IS2]|uniref:Uncharacterized protein n=1 Tax=Macrolepiota fuliginosa MF-IS2 TaxID=1400762 RepID=A0A9P5XQJ3_9AGAR|nr:hypothetical protein P691DRAFT_800733 [Macrolepiota fuliginosa MF-IS2]